MSEFKGWDIVITNELGATLKTIENRNFHQIYMFLESIKGTNIFGYVLRKNVNSKHNVKQTFQHLNDPSQPEYVALFDMSFIPALKQYKHQKGLCSNDK